MYSQQSVTVARIQFSHLEKALQLFFFPTAGSLWAWIVTASALCHLSMICLLREPPHLVPLGVCTCLLWVLPALVTKESVPLHCCCYHIELWLSLTEGITNWTWIPSDTPIYSSWNAWPAMIIATPGKTPRETWEALKYDPNANNLYQQFKCSTKSWWKCISQVVWTKPLLSVIWFDVKELVSHLLRFLFAVRNSTCLYII